MCDPGGARTVGGVRRSSRSVDAADDGPPSDPGADVDDVTGATRTRADRRRSPARWWGPLGTDRPTRSVRKSASPVASLAQELIAALHRLNRTVLIHSATHTQRSRRTASSICVARPGVFPETRRSFFFPAGRNFFGRSRPRKGAAAARISVVGTFKPGTVGSFGRESWVSRDVDARRQPIICHTGVSHLGNRIPLGRRSLTLEFKRNNFPGLKLASSTGGAYEVSQSDKVITL